VTSECSDLEKVNDVHKVGEEACSLNEKMIPKSKERLV
jgi:hypothetical protein